MKVNEINGFQVLRDDWNRILKSDFQDDNVFLTWEWLSTWWKHFGEGRRSLILTIEDRDEILGMAPLMLSKYKLPGLGSVRKIEFIGSPYSDYNNFIIPKKKTDCIGLIVNYLMENVPDWDWIELRNIPELPQNKNSVEALFLDFESKLRLKRRVCDICPYIPLPNSFDLLMKELDKKLRRNLNYYLRKINKEHNVELKKYDEAGYSVEEAMEAFIKLNEKRWTLKGELGSFKSKELAFRNFHEDIANCFAQKGWLGLYFLTVDSEPACAQYTFEYGQKTYFYLGGLDPQYLGYSIGNLTIMFLLKRCIERGFKEYDLMRGGELYKNRWACTYRRNFELRLVRRSLMNRLYDWVTWSNKVNNLAVKLKLSLKRSHA